jgi:hypothetical protein
MDGKEVGSVVMMQQFVENHSIANEMYYCEFRQDVEMMPSTFKFYKKTVTKRKEPLRHVKSESNPFQQLLRASTRSPEKLPELPPTQGTAAVSTVEAVFKYFDSSLNGKLQEQAKKAVEYVSAAFAIKVKKLVSKHIVSKTGDVYFLGLKELLIDVNEVGPYDSK